MMDASIKLPPHNWHMANDGLDMSTLGKCRIRQMRLSLREDFRNTLTFVLVNEAVKTSINTYIGDSII